MEQFERLEKEISEICKEKKIKFIWTNCYYDESYKLEFKTDTQKWGLLLNKKDLYKESYETIKMHVLANVKMFDEDETRTIIENNNPKNKTLDNLLIYLQSLCDDEYIKFSYYNDIDNQCYSFRFSKMDRGVIFKVSYVDLEYKPELAIKHEINDQLIGLYNEIRDYK